MIRYYFIIARIAKYRHALVADFTLQRHKNESLLRLAKICLQSARLIVFFAVAAAPSSRKYFEVAAYGIYVPKFTWRIKACVDSGINIKIPLSFLKYTYNRCTP